MSFTIYWLICVSHNRNLIEKYNIMISDVKKHVDSTSPITNSSEKVTSNSKISILKNVRECAQRVKHDFSVFNTFWLVGKLRMEIIFFDDEIKGLQDEIEKYFGVKYDGKESQRYFRSKAIWSN